MHNGGTMKTPASELSRLYKKKGFTLQSLAEDLGKGLNAVHRCVRGEARIPGDDAAQLSKLLFDSTKERSRFRRLCEEEYKRAGRENIAIRERKKRLTSASKEFHAHVELYSEPRIPEDAQYLLYFGKSKRPVGEKHKDLDFKYIYEPPSISVDILERRVPEDKCVMTIYSDMGLVFLEGHTCTYNKGMRDEIRGVLGTQGTLHDWNETIVPYKQFCNSRHLDPFVLLDLAREAVKQSDLLNPYTYTNKGALIVQRNDLDSINYFLDWDIGISESLKKGKKKSDILKEHNQRSSYASALVKAILKRPEDILPSRKKLLKIIDSVEEGLNREIFPK